MGVIAVSCTTSGDPLGDVHHLAATSAGSLNCRGGELLQVHCDSHGRPCAFQTAWAAHGARLLNFKRFPRARALTLRQTHAMGYGAVQDGQPPALRIWD